MKKLIYIIILSSLLSFSCNQIIEKEDAKYTQYKLNLDREFKNEQEIMMFIANNIEYKAEPKGQDYWQTPNETLELGTGDCEDFVILAVFLLKIKLNINSFFVTIKAPMGNHVILYKNNKYFDVIDNFEYKEPKFSKYYKITKYYSFFRICKKLFIF